MGGKDSGSSMPMPPAQSPTKDNSAEMLAMMSAMMEGMNAQMANAASAIPEAPVLPDAPAIESTPAIDWTEKMDQLRAKTRAEYSAEVSDKKGRMSTIHTSPLLDNDTEEEDTTLLGATTDPGTT